MAKKYKYLNYIPKPVKLDSSCYDLVNDDDFMKPDDRIPLLMATQFGIFPGGNYKGKYKGFRDLIGLENQTVGFIGRGYLSSREREVIIEILLDSNTIDQIRNKNLQIDLRMWQELK